jgi:hypothetical protein
MRYLLTLVFCCLLLCGCMKTTTVTITVKKSVWIENAWQGTQTSVTDIHDRTVTFRGRHDFTPGEAYEVVLFGQNGDNIQTMRKVTPGKVHIPTENKSLKNDRE